MFSRPHPLFSLVLLFAGATCNDGFTPTIDVPETHAFGTTTEMNVGNVGTPSAQLAPKPTSLIPISETKIVAPNGIASDLFGFSVAMSGDTLLVGTPYEDSSAQDAGAAYVFVRTNGVWTFEQKLVAPDFGAGRWFGYAVAIEGNNAIIGAPQADGSTLDSGAAYVYSRSNGMWTPLPKIVATDGKTGDMFGQAVDIAGNSLLVGCPQSDAKGVDAGAAYVYEWNGNAYVEQKKLLTVDSKAGDHFGSAVAMHGETAIVGAPGVDLFGTDSGAAYIFFRAGNLWSQQKKLISPTGAANDGFGWAVDIERDTAVVGSPMDDSAGVDAGAAFSFERTGISWNPSGNLAPQGLAPDDRFGSSVAMSGSAVVVGALLDDTADMNAGAAYVFKHNGFSWYQSLELLASDAAIGDAFGFTVAISGQTTVVSAYLDDDQGTSSGSTYVYELKSERGESCVTGGECSTGFCADGVCCDSACDLGPCDACSVPEGAKFAGVCTVVDGAVCDDGDACTQMDTCLSGQCMSGSPKMCAVSAQCAGTATCDPATGMCVGSLTPNGTKCDDNDACTITDACRGGVCRGEDTVSCPAADACHAEGICDAASGTCSTPTLPDGTVCPEGVCQAGQCTPPRDPILITGGGCICRAVPHAGAYSSFWAIGGLVGLWGMGRWRRTRRAGP